MCVLASSHPKQVTVERFFIFMGHTINDHQLWSTLLVKRISIYYLSLILWAYLDFYEGIRSNKPRPLARVFLLRQLWIVNYYIKSSFWHFKIHWLTNSNIFLDWIRLSPQGSNQGWIGSQIIEHGSNRVGNKTFLKLCGVSRLGPKVPNWVGAGCSSGWTICVDSGWVGLIWPNYFEGFFSVWVCGLISIKISFQTTLDRVFWCHKVSRVTRIHDLKWSES